MTVILKLFISNHGICRMILCGRGHRESNFQVDTISRSIVPTIVEIDIKIDITIVLSKDSPSYAMLPTAPNLKSTDITMQVEQPNRGTNLDS